jgi:hypothetical protein
LTRPGSKYERRISFNETNAEHIYEYLLKYWQDDPNGKTYGNCAECRMIGERLEKFIGANSVAFVKRQLQKK